jgi:hypothetical protein
MQDPLPERITAAGQSLSAIRNILVKRLLNPEYSGILKARFISPS